MNEQEHKAVCFGELLWDVLPDGAKPGGAPMNVAYHLQQLGMQPAVITRIGRDERGTALLKILQDAGVDTQYIQEDDTQPTGVVMAHLNAKGEATYDIVQPVAWDFIEGHEDLKKLVSAVPYFVFGSLAARSEASRNTLQSILQHAQKKVFDINLRAPHYTREVLENLLHQCDVLKINDAEIKLLQQWFGVEGNIESGMRFLKKSFNIPVVVTTCGAHGALLLMGDQVFSHPGFTVQVADTIGSGDAFLAAFLQGLYAKLSPETILKRANKLGAFVATQHGACPAYDVKAVFDESMGF